ncbi:MAG: hypothetical protein KAR42_17645 [candidate division Zixibacteria bacterium]|nr:hypothetical protein [candidate division Zixibacteria bacterium]
MKLLFVSIILIGAVFFPNGNDFGKSQSGVPSRESYEVVDTIRLVSGFGSMVLNGRFTTDRHNVKPTKGYYVYPSVTQIIDDTSVTVRYYAVYISDNLDSLIVKSSNPTDTSRVQVRVLMK